MFGGKTLLASRKPNLPLMNHVICHYYSCTNPVLTVKVRTKSDKEEVCVRWDDASGFAETIWLPREQVPERVRRERDNRL